MGLGAVPAPAHTHEWRRQRRSGHRDQRAAAQVAVAVAVAGLRGESVSSADPVPGRGARGARGERGGAYVSEAGGEGALTRSTCR